MTDRDVFIQIGDVYIMEFGGIGSEQKGLRPGLVFQNNLGNLHSPNIIALPITSRVFKKGTQPTHVLLRADLTGLLKDSTVLCESPECLSKERIGRFITRLSQEDMRRVAEASMLAFSIVSFLDLDSLVRVWRTALRLNGPIY